MFSFVFSENFLSRSIQFSFSNTNVNNSNSDNSPNINCNNINNGLTINSGNLLKLIIPNSVPIRISQQQEFIDNKIELYWNRVGSSNTNNNVNLFTQLYNHNALNNNNVLDEIKKKKVIDKYYSIINMLVELNYNYKDLEDLELNKLVNLYSFHHCKLEQIVKNFELKNFKERVNYLMAKFYDVLNKVNKYYLMFNDENKEITLKNLKLQYTLNAYIKKLNIHHFSVTNSVIKVEIIEFIVYLCIIRNIAMD
ncbi:hypothetical protein ABK040_016161 [Willaertia magna]